MIFIITGMEKFPFDRLIKIIDKNAENGFIKDKVLALIGNSNYVPNYIGYRKFLEYRDLVEYINNSNIIITHAGSGTVLLCLNNGKIPIIFPRLRKYGEHIDDHQVEFSKVLDKENKALVAYNEKELIYKLNHYFELIKKIKKSTNKIFSKDNLINYLEVITNGK